MKRKIAVILLSIAALSITACGQESKPASDAADTVASADSSVNEVLECLSTPEPTHMPTLTADETDVPEEETTYDCPDAIYPYSEWTPEELLTSYRDSTAPWEETQPEFYRLWSQEYAHRFSIVADWLWVDDVQALPLAEETHDISPDALVAAYQSGEWDGSDWWSEDYSTYVRLRGYDGTLDYHYSRYTYTEEGDPLGVAFTERGEIPAYFTEGNVFGFSSHDATGSSEWADVIIRRYVDLPGGVVENERDLLRVDAGTYLLTPDALSLYSHGKLVRQWILEADDETFLALRWEDDTVFICSSTQVQSVTPDTEAKVVLNNIVSTDYGYEGTCYVTVEEDGLWRCYEIFSGEVVSETEIPTREAETEDEPIAVVSEL